MMSKIRGTTSKIEIFLRKTVTFIHPFSNYNAETYCFRQAFTSFSVKLFPPKQFYISIHFLYWMLRVTATRRNSAMKKLLLQGIYLLKQEIILSQGLRDQTTQRRNSSAMNRSVGQDHSNQEMEKRHCYLVHQKSFYYGKFQVFDSQSDDDFDANSSAMNKCVGQDFLNQEMEKKAVIVCA